MVTQVVPQIEVVNHDTLHEAGYRFKMQMAVLKDQILDASGKGAGTRTGDKIIEEANEDPDFQYQK